MASPRRRLKSSKRKFMSKKKVAKNTLHLLHSDKLIMEILNASNRYLEQHAEVREKIEEYDWIFRSLFELIPETVENFWSGHVFPVTEAEYELECSIVLCKLGFYKHAIASLRNVLELGLLSVYWDIDDKSHIDIQNWLKSVESTPFRKDVFKKLKTNPNIKTLDEKQQIFEKTTALYTRLSNFSHTKGFGYSSRKLNKHRSNVNSFNEDSLKKYLDLMRGVVEIVTVFHILKYPVGLQETPIEQKFGLNGPAGGFIQPHQVKRIKRLVSKRILEDLQEISDNDSDAMAMTKWVNGRPDITEAEFLAQIEKGDKSSIEMEGFEHWLKNQKKLYKYFEKNKPGEYKEKLEYFEKLKLWAKENDHLKEGKFTKLNKQRTTEVTDK